MFLPIAIGSDFSTSMVTFAKHLTSSLLFRLYFIVIILLVTLPLNSASEFNNITILQFRGDYFLHSIMFLPWAFFGSFMKKHLPYWLFAGIIFAILAEGIQYLLPYRAFNVNDVLANIMGVVASFGLLFVYLRIRRKV